MMVFSKRLSLIIRGSGACDAVCASVALHCDVAVVRLQGHRSAFVVFLLSDDGFHRGWCRALVETEEKDKASAAAANRRAADVQHLLSASLSLACDVVAFIGPSLIPLFLL
jgi:hypothetical protein